MMSTTSGKRKRMDNRSTGNGEEKKKKKESLLGGVLTSDDIGTCSILPFLDFKSLISLRVTNKVLKKSVSEHELFSRSIVGLQPAASLDLRNSDFSFSVIARPGWSPKHTHGDAVVQSALDIANQFGKSEESNRILYEEGTALKLLEAGKSVSMKKFPRRAEEPPQAQREAVGGIEDDDSFDDDGNYYMRWKVDAPKVHKQISRSTAWKMFTNMHYLPLGWGAESISFARILFGLLINARIIRLNSMKSRWETSGMEGTSANSVLLIETTDTQKFEIVMDRDIDCEFI